MAQVTARPGESIDSLLKRFKKVTDRAGIMADFRKHEVFEKPSIQKRRKSAAARKREAKRQAKEAFMKLRKDKDRGGQRPYKKRKPRPQRPTDQQPQAVQPSSSTLVASSSNTPKPPATRPPQQTRPNNPRQR